MPMEIKFNPRMLEANIQNLADRAARGAAEELRKTAIKIRDLARDYAPIKTGDLERAIDYGSTNTGINRRKVFSVYIDLDSKHGKNKQIGDYAWEMEDGLSPYGSGKYNLGFGSLIKRGSGLKVGGKFLARAVREGTKGLEQRCEVAVKRSLSSDRTINMDYGGRRIAGDEE